ncbi:MAG TPA: hypothetical protein VKB09_08425 [Thermomicrobiales bacterium]|nr:hypothetical protein [Thermomicrobiales bacterium]
MTISFGRRRVILMLDWVLDAPDRQRPTVVELPASHEATDRELARINGRAAAAEERLRWEAVALLHGLPRP